MKTNSEKPDRIVLYVDDEEQALKYFRKALDPNFNVATAVNAKEAMALLEADPSKFGVVISDQRMPGESGVEFLGRIRQQWPNIVRILVTAYADFNVAVDAVNSGSIYKYLHKPVDFPLLRKTLTEAMELFQSKSQQETLVREKLSALQRMVVIDRVRSLAALAGGLSHHLRNSMTAMNCFLEEKQSGAPAAPSSRPGGDPFLDQLWEIARTERQGLLNIVESVEKGVVEPTCQPTGKIELASLIERSIGFLNDDAGDAKPTVTVAAGKDELLVDETKMAQAIAALLKHALLVGKNCPLAIEAIGGVQHWSASSARISIRASGAPWSDRDVSSLFTPFAFPDNSPRHLGMEPLAAFFIVYQHGGDVLVHTQPPQGPGFELILPLNPADVRRPEVGKDMMNLAFSPELVGR
jgi:two-component system probable response regulator PhcQ